jgi:RNA ligase
MKYNLLDLENRISEGLITKQKHFSYDLWIYNYTPKCQFDKAWDDLTTQCRGLILDGEGTIIARPFKKFFNIEEIFTPLPSQKPDIYKKLDGSLIIVTVYHSNLIIATRGSFTSDQARIANRLIYNNKQLLDFILSHEKQYTFLFELIGPSNQIVILYPKDELVLLAIINNEDSTEEDIEQYRNLDFLRVVEKIDAPEDDYIKYLKSLNTPNEEGFVLKWPDGYRVKVKFDNYLRLHKLVSNFNEKLIWQWLSENKPLDDIINILPDEYMQYFLDTYETFIKQYELIELYSKILTETVKHLPRKNAAIYIMNIERRYQSVVFKMLDGKDYSKDIWKLLKPKHGE